MSVSFFKTELDTSTAMRQLALSLEWIEEPNCMKEVGYIMGKYFNKFVPKNTGKLRKSLDVSHSTWKKSVILWTAPYAGYQYSGKVYVPNIPTFNEKGHSGWTSVKGRKKVRPEDGRFMGEKTGTFIMQRPNMDRVEVTVAGYTTPGTGREWVKVGRYDHKTEYADVRRKVLRALKRRYEARRVAYYG